MEGPRRPSYSLQSCCELRLLQRKDAASSHQNRNCVQRRGKLHCFPRRNVLLPGIEIEIVPDPLGQVRAHFNVLLLKDGVHEQPAAPHELLVDGEGLGVVEELEEERAGNGGASFVGEVEEGVEVGVQPVSSRERLLGGLDHHLSHGHGVLIDGVV